MTHCTQSQVLTYLLIADSSVRGDAVDCLEKGTVASVDWREAFAKEDV